MYSNKKLEEKEGNIEQVMLIKTKKWVSFLQN